MFGGGFFYQYFVPDGTKAECNLNILSLHEHFANEKCPISNVQCPIEY